MNIIDRQYIHGSLLRSSLDCPYLSLLLTIMRRAEAPDFGRGVSEPLQLKCLTHIGSAGPNETIPEGTVGSDVVEMSEASNKALNRE